MYMFIINERYLFKDYAINVVDKESVRKLKAYYPKSTTSLNVVPKLKDS